MITEETGEEFCRFCQARVGRDLMYFVRVFEKGFSPAVGLLRLISDLHSNGAFDYIAEHRTGMTVRRGLLTGRVGNFEKFHGEVIAI